MNRLSQLSRFAGFDRSNIFPSSNAARNHDHQTSVFDAAGGVGATPTFIHPSKSVHETSAWDVYNNEAMKVDLELIKDWTANLNSLLASIFSAVLSAFTIESKKLLEQDYAELMTEVMIFYINTRANGTISPYPRSDYQPSGDAILINCFLFASLGASLVAAFASIV
ncbi:hypothetical protein M408DRAFT_81899, partial [Serendipita vermifera MAFF 305830]